MSDPENPLEASPAAIDQQGVGDPPDREHLAGAAAAGAARPAPSWSAWASGRFPGCPSTPTPISLRRWSASRRSGRARRPRRSNGSPACPIETEMNGLPGIQTIRSISLFGLSSVDLIFKDGIDPYFAREQVFQRLSGVEPARWSERRCRAALLAVRAGLPVRADQSRSQSDGAQDAQRLGPVESLQGGARRRRHVGLRRPDHAVSGR